VDVVADNFGRVFPELRERKEAIITTLRAEEENFNKTLDRGIEVFEKVCVFSSGRSFRGMKHSNSTILTASLLISQN
jgi:alanyl-tRNA synthetase